MKICIVGVSGAGKTTLANTLSKAFSTLAYGYDEIYWDKSQMEYIKRPQADIDALVASIQSQGEWIVEGSYDKRLLPFLVDCSLIIRLKIPYRVCAYRIVKRFLVSKFTGARPQETMINTLALLRFAKGFDKQLDHFFEASPILDTKVLVIKDASVCAAQIKNHFFSGGY